MLAVLPVQAAAAEKCLCSSRLVLWGVLRAAHWRGFEASCKADVGPRVTPFSPSSAACNPEIRDELLSFLGGSRKSGRLV